MHLIFNQQPQPHSSASCVLSALCWWKVPRRPWHLIILSTSLTQTHLYLVCSQHRIGGTRHPDLCTSFFQAPASLILDSALLSSASLSLCALLCAHSAVLVESATPTFEPIGILLFLGSSSTEAARVVGTEVLLGNNRCALHWVASPLGFCCF